LTESVIYSKIYFALQEGVPERNHAFFCTLEKRRITLKNPLEIEQGDKTLRIRAIKPIILDGREVGVQIDADQEEIPEGYFPHGVCGKDMWWHFLFPILHRLNAHSCNFEIEQSRILIRGCSKGAGRLIREIEQSCRFEIVGEGSDTA
jgi:hypothetical protein